MGRKNKKYIDLPKGVYKTPTGYKAEKRINNKTEYYGRADTPEEAEYKLYRNYYNHHWKNMGDTSKYWGFIYLITNKKTGKRYVGQKVLQWWDGPRGGYKCYDKGSEWYDPKAWKESDWRYYTSSSIPLNEEIAQGSIWDYSYEVIKMCKDRLDLHLSEIFFMMDHDVLNARDQDGEYLWYNENIASVEFRPPFNKEQARDLSLETQEKMRNYYLKPQVDAQGNVVPFENQTGGFQDVR